MPAPKTKTAQEATQEAPATAATPAVDPGPPPVRPAQPLGSYHIGAANALYDAAGLPDRAAARMHIQAVDLMRLPPPVHRYRAELLSWLDALDAYYGVTP